MTRDVCSKALWKSHGGSTAKPCTSVWCINSLPHYLKSKHILFHLSHFVSPFLSSVEVYRSETDSWSEVASLNCRLQECAAAVVNQNLYVIGGVRCQLRNGTSYRCYDNGVERWQPDTNTWSTVASMHMCRSNHGVAVLNGKIYALGGYNGESYMKNVEVYCRKSNQWKMATPMLERRSIFTTAVVDGKIYAIGGYGPNYLNR